MKVCSLYGAGYYYMPGTDICVKLGGYIRYQMTSNPGASISSGPFFGPGGTNNRTSQYYTAHRTRALITVDTRQQTAYGTLRTYILLGFNQDSTAIETTAPTPYFTRGFLQIAGFTFGKATSFFDIVPGASFSYNSGMHFIPDTGDAGKMLAAYTAQFGNGVSGTIALEQSRVRGIVRGGPAPAGNIFVPGTVLAAAVVQEGGLAGTAGYPDLVGNIRIDQSWGTWLVGAAAKVNRGQYFDAATANATGTMNAGGPESKVGFAVTTGFILNLPMIAPGDRLSAGIVYSEGAIGYAAVTPTGGVQNYFSGNQFGIGFSTDAVYQGNITPAAPCPLVGGVSAGCGALQLTTAWSAAIMFEHLWTPALRTSWYGSYLSVSHNGAATALICNSPAVLAANQVFTPGNPALTGCDPDWSAWNVGTRTQWEPVKGLIMGVDVIYNKINTAQSNSLGLAALAAGGGIPATGTNNANCSVGNAVAVAANPPCYRNSDMDAITTSFRIQRDFLP